MKYIATWKLTWRNVKKGTKAKVVICSDPLIILVTFLWSRFAGNMIQRPPFFAMTTHAPRLQSPQNWSYCIPDCIPGIHANSTLPDYPGVCRIRHRSQALPYGSPYLPDKIIFSAFLYLNWDLKTCIIFICTTVSRAFLHVFSHCQRFSGLRIVLVCTSCKTSHNVLSHSHWGFMTRKWARVTRAVRGIRTSARGDDWQWCPCLRTDLLKHVLQSKTY